MDAYFTKYVGQQVSYLDEDKNQFKPSPYSVQVSSSQMKALKAKKEIDLSNQRSNSKF